MRLVLREMYNSKKVTSTEKFASNAQTYENAFSANLSALAE